MKTKIQFFALVLSFFVTVFSSNGQTNNTFTGVGAGVNNTGSSNSGFGVNALINNTSNSNSAFGLNTLPSTTGGFNSAFGASALASNTTGNLNCSFGTRSMELNTTGSGNVAMGHRALEFNTTGSNNVAIGYGAFFRQNNPPSPNVGSFNIAIGANTPRSFMSGDSNIFMGNETAINLINGNNNVIIGAGTRLEPSPSTSTLAGNNTSNTIILSTGSTQRFFIHSNGYAGIGLGNNQIPQNRLELGNGISGTSGLRFRNYNSSSTPVASNGRVLTLNANGDVVLTTDIGSGGTTLIQGGTNVTVTGTGVTGNPYIISSTASNCNLYSCDGTLTGNRTVNMNNNRLMFNTAANGRIYIGNTSNVLDNSNFPTVTGNYRLYVEGGILTEKVKVALRTTANWADYVFEDDYKLKSLKEVEAFIKENKHLPGIASAQELVESGLDLGEMQAKQMGKIEELTLYIIEQDKKLEHQSKDIEELKALVKVLMEKK